MSGMKKKAYNRLFKSKGFTGTGYPEDKGKGAERRSRPLHIQQVLLSKEQLKEIRKEAKRQEKEMMAKVNTVMK